MGVTRIPVSKGRVGGRITDHSTGESDDDIPTSSDIRMGKARKSYDYTPSQRRMAVQRSEDEVRYGTKIRVETGQKKEVSWGGRLAVAVVITLVVVFALLMFTPLGKGVMGFLP